MELNAINARLGCGDITQADTQWVVLLNDLMEEVSLDGLVNAGMPGHKARTLCALLALANRTVSQAEIS